MNNLIPQLKNSQNTSSNRDNLILQAISIAQQNAKTHHEARKKEWGNPEGGYFKWVKDNWTSRGEPLDFKEHKYLFQIYQDQSQEITYMKGAQTGLTERMITESMWLPDQHNANSIYIFPTGGTMSDLVQERIDEPINNSKYLRRVSGRAKRMFGKHADKIGLKRMSKGFIYFRGSGSPTQITSVPGDAIFVDEVDRMIQENIPYFDKRLEHSKLKWQRWASTPTLPNFGIHKRFLLTDQLHFYLKCPKCGTWQILDFFENVIFEMKSDHECDWAKLVCHSCKEEIVPWECEGEWKAHNPSSGKRGYFVSKLYSPFMDIKKVVESSVKTAEWEKMQFYNQDLGLPYAPEGGVIDINIINACRREYMLGERTGTNYMGIDVGLYLHVIIQNKDGQIVEITKVKAFEDLDKLMNEFNIKSAVIDALPETREAQKFAQRFKGRVYLCYYSKLAEPKPDEWFQANAYDMKVNTRRTLSLDNWSNRFRQQDIQLPKNISEHSEFIEHMGMLTRVIEENRAGDLVAKYVKTGPDHYYHAGNYSNIAKAINDSVAEPDFDFV